MLYTELSAEAFGIHPLDRVGGADRRPVLPRGRTVAFLALAAVLGLLFVWPLAMLMAGAFRKGGPGEVQGWTLRAVADVVSSSSIAGAAVASAVLAVTATVAATVIAAALAYLTERTDLPGRRWVAPVMAALFATPGIFYAVACSQLDNRYAGYLNVAFQALTASSSAPYNI